MPTQPDTVIHVRASADLARRLDDFAGSIERTRNFVARKLLENALTAENRVAALQAISDAGRAEYAANATRADAPNATEIIAASSTEGHARLRALNEIARGGGK
jgi:predicted transcriptional regulator